MIIKSHEIPKIVRGHWSTQGLIGYWPMMPYEVGGSKIFDLSGHRNTGTFGAGATSPIWQPGPSGSSVRFDGSDKILGSSFKGPLSFPLTIVALIKLSATGVWNPLFCTHDLDDAYYGTFLHIHSSDAVWLQYGDGGGTIAANRNNKTGSTSLIADQWYHIVGVIRGKDDMDIYLNGVDDGGTYSGTATTMSTAAGLLTFGQWLAPTDYWLRGNIASVSLYNRGLSAFEAVQLFRNPLLPIEREPIELWVGATSVGVAPPTSGTVSPHCRVILPYSPF